MEGQELKIWKGDRIQGDSELCGRRKETGLLEYESSEKHLWKTEQ